jgi:ERCC4-related helicase
VGADVMDLRPYQIAVIAECYDVVANGKRRPIIVAPTGAGKTVISAAIIKAAMAERRRVLVLGHTREIIKQSSLKFSRRIWRTQIATRTSYRWRNGSRRFPDRMYMKGMLAGRSESPSLFLFSAKIEK